MFGMCVPSKLLLSQSCAKDIRLSTVSVLLMLVIFNLSTLGTEHSQEVIKIILNTLTVHHTKKPVPRQRLKTIGELPIIPPNVN
jgi:hypothetical protein